MEDFYKLWEELNQLEQGEFLSKEDYEDFQYYLKNDNIVLMEMANVVGNSVRVEARLPFSFHFCGKSAVHNQHGIGAKIIWNPSKAPNNVDGYMDLHGNYEYIISNHKYKPTGRELEIARSFFRKYKVLFAAVWEEVLDPSFVQDYLRGYLDFKNLLTQFDLQGRDYYNVNHCKTIKELEACIRKYRIFNMND